MSDGSMDGSDSGAMAVTVARISRMIKDVDRDRGAPHGAAPPTPPGIRVTYHGGSTELSRWRDIESGETK